MQGKEGGNKGTNDRKEGGREGRWEGKGGVEGLAGGTGSHRGILLVALIFNGVGARSS